MRTAIISDLHLGSGSGKDLLLDGRVRSALWAEIDSADRLVLLGDALDLLERPLASALGAAQQFFEELGEVMAGRQVLLVPGNHDNRLAEPLLEQVALDGRQLGFEQRVAPSSEAASQIAVWLGNAELEIAYPGAWLRADVYATHGHYMDCHRSLPRLDCIAAAVSMRVIGPPPAPAAPADYERVLHPLYEFAFSLAQVGLARRATRPSERVWRAMAFGRNGSGVARRTAVNAGVRAGVWGLNRLLHADFGSELSPTAISNSGVAAATELVERLQIDASHTIVGHTHWDGPGENEMEWKLPGGGCLHNTGNWIFGSALHPATPPGPCWPGTVTWVEDDCPPRRVRLLIECSYDELKQRSEALLI